MRVMLLIHTQRNFLLSLLLPAAAVLTSAISSSLMFPSWSSSRTENSDLCLALRLVPLRASKALSSCSTVILLSPLEREREREREKERERRERERERGGGGGGGEERRGER